jgi:hypothetical protein
MWQLPHEFQGRTDAMGQYNFGPFPIDSLREAADVLLMDNSLIWPYRLSVRAEGFPEVMVALPNILEGQIAPAMAYVKHTENHKQYALAEENGQKLLRHFADANTLRVDVVMGETGSISGWVVDTEGNRIPSLPLELDLDMELVAANYGEAYGVGKAGVVDGEGNFRVTVLPKGNYVLEVLDSAHTDEPTKLKVHIAAGEELEGIVVVVPSASDVWTIDGRVLDLETGEPIEDATLELITLQPREMTKGLRAFQTEEGEREADSLSFSGTGTGKLRLRAEAPGRVPEEVTQMVFPGARVELDVTLGKPVPLRVDVTRDGEQINGAMLRAYTPEFFSGWGGRYITHFHQGGDGVYHLEEIEPGEYCLEVSEPRIGPDSSPAIVRQRITVPPGNGLELSVQFTGTSQVFGMFEPGESDADYRDIVLRQGGLGGSDGVDSRRGIVSEYRIDYPHRYTFTGVPAGTYQLELLTGRLTAEYEFKETPTVLGTVTLAEGEAREFNLGNLGDLE